MVLDTSAVIAILFDKPEREPFLLTLAANPRSVMSSMIFYEISLVAVGKKRNPRAAFEVDEFVGRFSIEVISVELESARSAREAYFRFGKNYHPASLNLADCFSYSLAKSRNEPLLFKGGDFLKTDIVPAWRP